jgi:ribosomal protein L37AE/L43A
VEEELSLSKEIASAFSKLARERLTDPGGGESEAQDQLISLPTWLEEKDCVTSWGVRTAVPEAPEKNVRESLPYWEAYPILQATPADHSRTNGMKLCLWIDPKDLVVGGAEVSWISGDKLQVRYCLQRSLQLEGGSGIVVLETVRKGSLSDNKRVLFRCPDCGEARMSLGFKSGHWACRACHHLGYRSTMIGSAVLKAEKYRHLEAELLSLRKGNLSKAKLKRLEGALETARLCAGPLPHPTASLDYVYRITADWVEGVFSEDGFY